MITKYSNKKRLKFVSLTFLILFLVSCGSRDKAQTHFEDGMEYVKINEFEKAITELNKAIELKPEMFEAYGSLSICYYALGNEEMGLEYKTKWEKLAKDMGYDVSKLENLLEQQ